MAKTDAATAAAWLKSRSDPAFRAGLARFGSLRDLMRPTVMKKAKR